MAKKKSPSKDKLVDELGAAMGRLQATDTPGDGPNVVQLIHREGDSAAPILLYDTASGTRLELRFSEGEPWVTYGQMAATFGVAENTVVEHVQKYLSDGEIDQATTRKFRVVRQEGNREVRREIEHFGLDVAFYVGYRVNSRQGALFRRWATDILVRFAKYGYAMDVERLKAPDDPGIVDELKEIIREIRSSTQNVYREVRKIVSLCQDYDGKSETAHAFYARMENKLLYVATSMTAPELSSAPTPASRTWASPTTPANAVRRRRTPRSPITT